MSAASPRPRTPSTRVRVLVLALALFTAACRGEHRPARELYNQGVAALERRDYDGAQKLLLEARSKAGIDPELRFRAAYDLGVTYAAHADQVKLGQGADGQQPDLSRALELAQQALSWFSDAARLRKDDPQTVANLAIVRARVQAISDQLREAEGSIEARLDRLIQDQRAVLDDGRAAWLEIRQAGGADPLAKQGALTRLADRERAVVAEAGVVGDLAADEIDKIGVKPEDERSDEERARVVQLKNLDLYVVEARTRIAEARRKLQELAAEDGVDRAEAALIALKRGREQLLDPITVLQGVAQDELALMQETTYASSASGPLELEPEHAAAPPASRPPIPAWLASNKLAERQSGLRDRVDEVRARMVAASLNAPDPNAPPPAPAPANPTAPAQDAEQAKLIARVRAALPAIGDASAAMGRAHEALGHDHPRAAIEHQRAALIALAAAIEQFADLKQTIELAHADQQRLVTLLSPEATREVPAAERATESRDALARNLARMPRLRELIADEATKLAAQATQAAEASQPSPAPAPAAGSAAAGSAAPAPDPQAPEAEAARQALEQQQQRLVRAEELRAQTQVALEQLANAITANKDPLTPGKLAADRLTELRTLFFSVIEHLQQLIRDQGETRDQTSSAHGLDPLSREPKLPGLIGRQDGHGQLATAITDALAAQADDAAKQGAQPQPGAPDPKALSAAAAEVRLAHGAMADATRTLTKARDATAASESLEPAVTSQAQAIEHLVAALRHLQPPKQDDQQQQDKQQQQQPQQQDPKPPDPKDQPQAGGAGQRARDEDARRQRERARQAGGSDPVEKDW